ncbi:MAG TPA: hypothetical protein VMF91_15825 [Bryobacteraceae bacterium]|nr:hypothetical protein [Bryobacteraceae bacterium]
MAAVKPYRIAAFEFRFSTALFSCGHRKLVRQSVGGNARLRPTGEKPEPFSESKDNLERLPAATPRAIQLAPSLLPLWAKEGFMFKRAFLLLPLAALAAGVAWAADDPMVGNWKLNPQKSKLTDEMKVTSLGGNKYAFDFGGNPETIVVDGTDQPANFGTTFAVTEVAPDEWTGVRKKDGRVEIKGIWKLSKDGNTLHDDFTFIADNRKTTHLVYLYERRGGGSGFAGDWVSTKEQRDTVYVLQVKPFEGDGLSFITSGRGTKNVKFDGKDYPNVGSGMKVVSSAQRVNERTVELRDKIGGKEVDAQEISVSQDGKTLTMTVHVPGRSEPNVLVFEKE